MHIGGVKREIILTPKEESIPQPIRVPEPEKRQPAPAPERKREKEPVSA